MSTGFPEAYEDESVVRALRETTDQFVNPAETTPVGETYGSDARHYLGAGIPTVVFGPGRIEAAHFPDESIDRPELLLAGDVLTETARRYLA